MYLDFFFKGALACRTYFFLCLDLDFLDPLILTLGHQILVGTLISSLWT